MSNQAIKAKMIATARQLSAEQIKAELVKLADNMEAWADHLYAALLDTLESKVSEKEFIEFCESI